MYNLSSGKRQKPNVKNLQKRIKDIKMYCPCVVMSLKIPVLMRGGCLKRLFIITIIQDLLTFVIIRNLCAGTLFLRESFL